MVGMDKAPGAAHLSTILSSGALHPCNRLNVLKVHGRVRFLATPSCQNHRLPKAVKQGSLGTSSSLLRNSILACIAWAHPKVATAVDPFQEAQ